MATNLATIFDWLVAAKVSEQAASRARLLEEADPFEAPAFPNEDVYFFVKSIDNSRVAREADPAARRACWRMIGSTFAAALLVISLLLPTLNRVLAGYRLEALRQERARLELERASLELQESRLLTPARLEELAKMQRFVDPAPQKVVYLEEKTDTTIRASR